MRLSSQAVGQLRNYNLFTPDCQRNTGAGCGAAPACNIKKQEVYFPPVFIFYTKPKALCLS